jgi:hypothetical protein
MFLGDGGRRRSLSLRWNCCFLFPDFESSDFLFLLKLSNVLCIIVHLHISLNACLALHKLSLSRGVTSRSET